MTNPSSEITLKVAMLQMSSSDDVEANIAKVESYLEDLKGAELVVLPEMWSYLIPDHRGEERYEHAKKYSELIRCKLKKWAEQTKAIWVAGSILETCEKTKKVKNSCRVISPKGQELGHYEKMHLFDNLLADRQFSESRTVAAGEELSVLNFESFIMGLGICYDLRFAYHFQALSEMGANMVVLPSAFSYKTGEAHWEVLLRARAIENQSYVLACNQSGSSVEGVHCWGHSMIIDPWGKVVAELEHKEGLLWAELNFDFVREVREKMPVLSHRLFTLEDRLYDPNS